MNVVSPNETTKLVSCSIPTMMISKPLDVPRMLHSNSNPAYLGGLVIDWANPMGYIYWATLNDPDWNNPDDEIARCWYENDR